MHSLNTCIRVVLEENMVQGTKLKHSVWVIHPTRLWCDVKLRVLCSCLVQGESDIGSTVGSRQLSQQSVTTCTQLERSKRLQPCMLLCVCNACSSGTTQLIISDAQAQQARLQQQAEGC